jgi:hypothetical protein
MGNDNKTALIYTRARITRTRMGDIPEVQAAAAKGKQVAVFDPPEGLQALLERLSVLRQVADGHVVFPS